MIVGNKLSSGLIGFIALLGLGLFSMLYVSFKYIPDNSESMYMKDYRTVDRDINSIVKEQIVFDNKYDINI